ncbi:alcohol dehydrogenase [Vibrio ishigakensis]|uniref:Alcohol dehydrogenase n=1 Tax=Vibrio ishigakensis TaxID=1481914 RepID=A0A0B8QJ27_9VIBR|nr:alcohol dehydrogenase [Vibrio ishigakensis]
MLPTSSYAAFNSDDDLKPYDFNRRQVGARDVHIEILYCGVCHSDIHMAHNDWGFTQYPIVPGHEIIGRVVSTGGDVSRFKAGDLVGVGCMVDSCRTCEPCKNHLEQHCEKGMIMTYGSLMNRAQMPLPKVATQPR